MTTRGDDGAGAPPPGGTGGDADADADAAWLLARARGEDAPPPHPDTAATYQRLEGLLAELPPVTPPPDWRAAILRRVDEDDARAAAASAQRRARARRRAWFAAGPALAMIAVVVIFVGLRPPSGDVGGPPITYAITAGDGRPRGDGPVALGEHLTVTARLPAEGALRIYRDDRVLVAECPSRGPVATGAAVCTQRRAGKVTVHVATLRLDAPGRYRVVLLIGAAPPSTGRYDDDVAAAPAAGVTLRAPDAPLPATFDVR